MTPEGERLRKKVVLEATYGWYWRGKAFTYRRLKNDERDAADLADLLRTGRLPEAWIAPADVRDLRELTRYRSKLVGKRTSCKDQVHAVLAKLPLPLWRITKNVTEARRRAGRPAGLLAARSGGQNRCRHLRAYLMHRSTKPGSRCHGGRTTTMQAERMTDGTAGQWHHQMLTEPASAAPSGEIWLRSGGRLAVADLMPDRTWSAGPPPTASERFGIHESGRIDRSAGWFSRSTLQTLRETTATGEFWGTAEPN